MTLGDPVNKLLTGQLKEQTVPDVTLDCVHEFGLTIIPLISSSKLLFLFFPQNTVLIRFSKLSRLREFCLLNRIFTKSDQCISMEEIF